MGAGALLGCRTLGGDGESELLLAARAVDPAVPRRPDWRTLSRGDKRAFVDAIRAMKGIEVAVPASFGEGGARRLDLWAAMAETHQWYCQHKSWRFLPWHRAYLHVFELQLRALIRDSFRLPYWSWDEDHEVPAELQDPSLLALCGVARPRSSIVVNRVNDGDLSESWWSKAAATLMTAPDFDALAGDADSGGTLESPYHLRVHVSLGGEMARIPVAARDPVFWLHHCNVDRLWSLWMSRQIEARQLRSLWPSRNVGTWLAETFPETYWMPDRTLRSIRVEEVLFAEALGYTYDGVREAWTARGIPRDLAAVELRVSGGGAQGAHLTASSAQDEALGVSLALRRQLFTSGQRLQSLRLLCFGLPPPRPSGVSYRVELRRGEQRIRLDDLVFFDADTHVGHAMAVDASRHVATLAEWSGRGEETLLLLTPQREDGAVLPWREVVDDVEGVRARLEVAVRVVLRD